MNAANIINRITALEGVTEARLWDRVPGKERIYFGTVKRNGGKAWNGGVGFVKAYIDLTTGTVVMDGEAGGATRNYHAEIHTREDIERIVQEERS